MTFHLDRCDYFGLEASKIAAHSYTEKDANVVADRVRNEGFHRAWPRANPFLTVARILLYPLSVGRPRQDPAASPK